MSDGMELIYIRFLLYKKINGKELSMWLRWTKTLSILKFNDAIKLRADG